MMKRIRQFNVLLLLLLLLLGGTTVQAQQAVRTLSLDEILQMGGANNLTLKEYRQRQQMAVLQAEIAKDWWLPDLYAGITMHQLWGSAMNGNGAFFTDVNRQNMFGGLGFNAKWDFSQGKYGKEAGSYRAQATQYWTQTFKNEVLLKSIGAYYEMLTAQLTAKAYQQLILETDTLIRQLEIQVDAGLKYQSELLMAKGNLSHLKVERLNAESTWFEQSNALKQMLNLKQNSILMALDSVLAPIDLMKDSQAEGESAYKARPEYEGMQLMMQATETERRRLTKGLLLPELSISATGGLFGDVFTPLYPTAQINGGLLWHLPTERLFSKRRVLEVDLKMGLESAQLRSFKNQVNLEVANAMSRMEMSRSRMAVSEEGSGHAREALSQCMQRQALGTVTPYEILQSQELYLKTKLDFLKAVAGFNQAQYELFVALGGDL